MNLTPFSNKFEGFVLNKFYQNGQRVDKSNFEMFHLLY